MTRGRAVVVTLLLLLAACGGDDKPTAATSASTTTSTTEADVAVHLEWFSSPSKNIGCRITEDDARCDVSNYEWSELPAKPVDCEFDWGGALIVGQKGPGEVGCVSDTELGATDVLAYGTATTAHGFTCTSESSGMTCRNDATGHGFEIARARYDIF